MGRAWERVKSLVLSRDRKAIEIAERKQSEEMIQQMLVFAEEMLGTRKEQLPYEVILNNLIYISGAKYAAFNMLDDDTGFFTTVAVAGIGEKLAAVTKVLGFELVGRRWEDYYTKNEKIQKSTITHFSSIKECAGSVIPDLVTRALENIFGCGEVAVAKIIIDEKMVGDYTLIMPQGQILKNEGLVEIYTRQINLYLSRVKAEESLVKSEKRYRKVFNIGMVSLFLIDQESGSILEANQSACSNYGYSYDEIVGLTNRDISAEPEQTLQAMQEAQAPMPIQYHKKRDGTLFPVEILASLFVQDNRKVLLVATHDITSRKQIENALIESKERQIAIFNQSPIAIELFDDKGYMLSANEACLQLFGVIHREEVIGFKLFNDPNVTEEVKRKLLDGESVKIQSKFDFEQVKKLGLYATTRSGVMDLDLSITSLRNGQKVEGYIVQILDISERRILEAALLEIKANKIKSDFLSIMSHELRSPLNPVISLSGVLSRSLAGIISKEQQSYLEVIERNGKKLLTIIDELLDITQAEFGHVELEIAAFDLNNLIGDTVAKFQPVAQLKNIKIIHNPAEQEIWVTSDQKKLGHILQSIIDNAVKFTEKGSVEIRCQKDNAHVSVLISDTGIGINEEHLPQVFKKFKQVDGSITRKYGGTGLGLAISKNYAEMLGGSIDVQSAPGKGSIFTVTVPTNTQARRQA